MLQKLVKAALTDLPKVILDYPKGAKKGCGEVNTGGFELVHKAQNEVMRPKNNIPDLRVWGYGVRFVQPPNLSPINAINSVTGKSNNINSGSSTLPAVVSPAQ